MIKNSDNMIQAARTGLAEAMASDDRVMVLGEDVASGGGPFALTRGLAERHGAKRVRNTPICESTIMGVGVGMALGGARPFVDIMFNDFMTIASDQLFNNAAKIHYMSGGRYSVPITVWSVAGAEGRWGAQHSQHLAGWFAQVPGVKVLSPSSPELMYASVIAAIEDPDPVVLLVDRPLLYSRAALANDDASPWQPRVVQEGTDLTMAAAGRLVHVAIEAAAASERSVEVIDLQRIVPVEVGPIVESVAKTGHLVIAHDEVRSGGLTALIEAAVYKEAFWALDAPVIRVTSPATPIPTAPNLEDAYIVSADDLRQAIDEVMNP